jgi:glyoxylase I family protein
MQIESILHASVIVRDVAHSLRFYRDVLGLRVDDARPDLGYPGAWLWINPRQQIHLLQVPNPDSSESRPTHGGRDRHTALAIDDLDELRVRLDAAGVAYTVSKSGRQALFCRDPDGNAWEFVQGTEAREP